MSFPTIQAPQLAPGYKSNYNTLQEASRNGDLALCSAIRKSDNQTVALVCAVNWDGEHYEMVPLAVMCEGNPFDDFIPPQ